MSPQRHRRGGTEFSDSLPGFVDLRVISTRFLAVFLRFFITLVSQGMGLILWSYEYRRRTKKGRLAPLESRPWLFTSRD